MTMQEQSAFESIDDVKKALLENGLNLAHDVLHQAESVLKKSIEERKTGRWISEIVEKEDWKGIKRKYFQPNSCSVCHNPSNIGEDYPYCPHCGAKMKGVEE